LKDHTQKKIAVIAFGDYQALEDTHIRLNKQVTMTT
jgi:hypothetical protein